MAALASISHSEIAIPARGKRLQGGLVLPESADTIAPLDIFLVRKLGVPGHEEFAMGAIAAGRLTVLSEDLILGLGITPAWSRKRSRASSRSLSGANGCIAETGRRRTWFRAVGEWYEDFSQTTDEEVRELLAAASETARHA